MRNYLLLLSLWERRSNRSVRIPTLLLQNYDTHTIVYCKKEQSLKNRGSGFNLGAAWRLPQSSLFTAKCGVCLKAFYLQVADYRQLRSLD